MELSTVGLDLAKNVLQLHAIDGDGSVVLRKLLCRAQVLAFFANLPGCVVWLEAGGSANLWARELIALGHDVRIIPPSYVTPCVCCGENDMADAEAISEAVQRSNMRFVPVKSEGQPSALMRHKARNLIQRQRTMIINALRAHMAELGVVAAQGPGGVADLIEIIADDEGETIPRASRRRRCARWWLDSEPARPSPGNLRARSAHGIETTRPAGASPRSRALERSPPARSQRPCRMPRSSARGANSRPGSGSHRGRTPAAARIGSDGRRNRAIVTSDACSRTGRPASCVTGVASRAPRRPGSTGCSTAGHRGWSRLRWPTSLRPSSGRCSFAEDHAASPRPRHRRLCIGAPGERKGWIDMMQTGRTGGQGDLDRFQAAAAAHD